MKSVSEVHFRVVDHGLFLPIARRLAREGSRVTYWSPNDRAFPTLKDKIGDGYEEVERVEDVFEGKDEVDCWVFPDIGFSGLQAELLSHGRLVWGARTADELEIDRGRFLDTLDEVGLSVPPHTVIQGMANLKAHLYDQENKWVKLSRYRGDWETLHFRNWAMDELELDVRAVKLGPWKEELTFYVFDEIPTTIEDGCDTHSVGGEFPSLVLHGMEAKDKAYLGTFQEREDLPGELLSVLEALGPVLGEKDARTLFSIEVRITSAGEAFPIDPSIRAGSPPSQVMCELVDNLGEIFWAGANGELVDPYPYAKFGVQAVLTVPEDRDYVAVEFPEELDRWVKCWFCARIGSRDVIVPCEHATRELGYLVGVGDTIDEAIRHLQHNIKLLPPGVSCSCYDLVDLIKEVQEAEEKGMEFTDQPVPEPESIIENT